MPAARPPAALPSEALHSLAPAPACSQTGKFVPEKSNIWRDCVDGYYDWVKEHIEEVGGQKRRRVGRGSPWCLHGRRRNTTVAIRHWSMSRYARWQGGSGGHSRSDAAGARRPQPRPSPLLRCPDRCGLPTRPASPRPASADIRRRFGKLKHLGGRCAARELYEGSLRLVARWRMPLDAVGVRRVPQMARHIFFARPPGQLVGVFLTANLC